MWYNKLSYQKHSCGNSDKTNEPYVLIVDNNELIKKNIVYDIIEYRLCVNKCPDNFILFDNHICTKDEETYYDVTDRIRPYNIPGVLLIIGFVIFIIIFIIIKYIIDYYRPGCVRKDII